MPCAAKINKTPPARSKKVLMPPKKSKPFKIKYPAKK